MPKVPIYTAEENITPNDRASSAAAGFGHMAMQMGIQRGHLLREEGAAIARGIGDIGASVKYAAEKQQQHEDMMELSQVNRDYIQNQMESETDYNKFMADNPNDRDAPNRFLDQYNEKLDQMGQNIKSPRVQQHFESLRMQGMRTMAGHIKNDTMRRDAMQMEGTLNSVDAATAQRLYGPQPDLKEGDLPNYADSERVQNVLQERETLIMSQLGAMSEQGNLTPEAQRKVIEHIANGRKQLLQEVWSRRAMQNPDQARKDLADPRGLFHDIFDAKELGKAEDVLQRIEKQKVTEGRAARTDAQKQEDDGIKDNMQRLETSLRNPDGTRKKPTADDLKTLGQIELMPGAERSREALEKKRGAMEKAIYDPGSEPNALNAENYKGLIQGMNTGRMSEIDADRMYANGDITKEQHTRAQDYAKSSLADKKAFKAPWDDFMKRYAVSVDTAYGQTDTPQGSALGQQQIFKFEQAAREKYNALKGAGQDPNQLFDPKSPHFLGDPKELAKWRVSLTDANKYSNDLAKEAKITSQIQDYTSQGSALRADGAMPAVKGMIIHHSGGSGTVENLIDVLKKRNLSVQFAIDRDGKIYQLMPDGAKARHMMEGWGEKGEGRSNGNMEGVEVIAKDNNDVTPAQVAAVRTLVESRAKKFGYNPMSDVFGHGEVNPGHKEKDEGKKAVNTIRADAPPVALPDHIRSPQEIMGFLKPGQKFIIPDGKFKGQIGTVPLPKQEPMKAGAAP